MNRKVFICSVLFNTARLAKAQNVLLQNSAINTALKNNLIFKLAKIT